MKILRLISFKEFERLYVETHGLCKTKTELARFFNLARKFGLKK